MRSLLRRLFAMNDTSRNLCAVSVYLTLCASSKVLLLVPGLVLNMLILASVLACVLGRRGKIRGNVAMFVLGSTGCNLLSLGLWPLTIHWGQRGRWLLGAGPCELMVSAKHLSSTASFYYVSLIAFSVYLTVACDCGRLASSRLFLALQLLFPLIYVGAAELGLWLAGGCAHHLDPVALTCFSFINDRAARVLALVNTAVLLPSNLYFYGHILYSVTRSGRLIHRSRKVNCRLATIFSLISLITLTAHIPGAVFALMDHPSVCQEIVRDLLMDLPLLSNPIILLCMNKELRNQCLLLLCRHTSSSLWGRQWVTPADKQRRKLKRSLPSTLPTDLVVT